MTTQIRRFLQENQSIGQQGTDRRSHGADEHGIGEDRPRQPAGSIEQAGGPEGGVQQASHQMGSAHADQLPESGKFSTMEFEPWRIHPY